MSNTKDDTMVASAPSVTTETKTATSGSEDSSDKKVVETVDFRSSAAGQTQETKSVAVVHEPADSGADKKPSAPTKQD